MRSLCRSTLPTLSRWEISESSAVHEWWGVIHSDLPKETVLQPVYLPGGACYDLVGDPMDDSVLYTNVVFADSAGGTNGLYKSTDMGASWTKVSDADD